MEFGHLYWRNRVTCGLFPHFFLQGLESRLHDDDPVKHFLPALRDIHFLNACSAASGSIVRRASKISGKGQSSLLTLAGSMVDAVGTTACSYWPGGVLHTPRMDPGAANGHVDPRLHLGRSASKVFRTRAILGGEFGALFFEVAKRNKKGWSSAVKRVKGRK
jgi:hypothetical protein